MKFILGAIVIVIGVFAGTGMTVAAEMETSNFNSVINKYDQAAH